MIEERASNCVCKAWLGGSLHGPSPMAWRELWAGGECAASPQHGALTRLTMPGFQSKEAGCERGGDIQVPSIYPSMQPVILTSICLYSMKPQSPKRRTVAVMARRKVLSLPPAEKFLLGVGCPREPQSGDPKCVPTSPSVPQRAPATLVYNHHSRARLSVLCRKVASSRDPRHLTRSRHSVNVR